MQKEYPAFIENFLKEMALRCLAETKKRTPVDSGELREKWVLSDIRKEGSVLEIDLINPMNYASHVEQGHRQKERFLPFHVLDSGQSLKLKQELESKYPGAKGIMLKEKWIPGAFMAEISLEEIREEMPQQYKRAFDLWVKRFS